MKHYVEIAGIMGTGKTSLARIFNNVSGFQTIIENEADLKRLFFVEPYLNNLEKFAFEGNINFAAFHLNRIQEAYMNLPPSSTENPHIVINDVSPITQFAYAQTILPADELAVLDGIIGFSCKKLPKADLRIVPFLPIDTHVERIRQRGRETEETIPRAFLEVAQKNLDRALLKFGAEVPTLYLDSSKMDWVNNEDDKTKVIKLIKTALKTGVVPPRPF
jgi:deoxyguanosine kinase